MEKRKIIVCGSPASPGEAVGIAKIAFYAEEACEKIKDGDILVTPMTDPGFVPAMIKASAIVTDFGGILCHAAIVSRELGKPCVIGTKRATELIKEGEKILVNGDKGEVYALEEEEGA
jgi:pyruvate,water dikinase